MGCEKNGGFLLTDLEASNLFLFVDDILGRFKSSGDYCRWVNPDRKYSDDRLMATSIIMNRLTTSQAFEDYIASLDPKEIARQTYNELEKAVLEKEAAKC